MIVAVLLKLTMELQGGVNNAKPSTAGLADVATLRSIGWTQRRKCRNGCILLDQSHTCHLWALLPSLDIPQRKFHMLHIYLDLFYKPYFLSLSSHIQQRQNILKHGYERNIQVQCAQNSQLVTLCFITISLYAFFSFCISYGEQSEHQHPDCANDCRKDSAQRPNHAGQSDQDQANHSITRMFSETGL